jgi:hypothetical protein
MNHKPILYNFNDENIISVVRNIKDETKFKTLENTKNIETNKGDIKEDILIKEDISEKELKENEKIYWISKTTEPDVYNLHNKESLNEKAVGIACVNNLAKSKMLRLAFKNKNASTLIKFKCIFDQKFNKWTPEYAII